MAGYEDAVPLMVDGRDLPLLQDTTAVNATGAWEAIWRDVFVLDANNEVTAIYNLTQHNLAEQDNYDELRQLLIDAATP